jgi:peptide/nickel transport system substrate-binding protein
VMLALDPEVINDRAYQGALPISKSYFGPDSPYFSSDMKPFPTDAARAAELVEELKAEGWDGTLNFVASNVPPGSEAALAIEAMLGAVGISLDLELMGTGDSIGRLGRGEFDIITNGWNSGPDTSLLSLVRNASSTSPTNRMGYKSEAMDVLLNEGLATPLGELPSVMARINDQLNADFAAVTYAVGSEGVVWQDNVKGIVPTMSTIFLFHDAYLED